MGRDKCRDISLGTTAQIVHCSMILNGNIFQTAPSSEFRTGSSLEKYVLSQLTNLEFRTGVSLEFVFFHMIEYIAKKNTEYFHSFIALDILQRKDGYYSYMNTIHRIGSTFTFIDHHISFSFQFDLRF